MNSQVQLVNSKFIRNMKKKEIIIDNNKIFYRERIDYDTNNIYVFLHGWNSNSDLFSGIYKNLSNFIALDFPNMGRSSNLTIPWNLLDYAKFTKKFLDKKIHDKKIIFIVHSFGGRVLIKMLNIFDFKHKIHQIICVGVPFVRENKSSINIIHKFTKIGKNVTDILPIDTKKNIKSKWYKILGVQDYSNISDEVTQKTFQNIVNEDIEIYIENLKNFKVDFIWGENDKEAPLKYAKVIAKKLNINIAIIKNSNHFPFIHPHTEEFVKILNKLIK